MAWYPYVTTLGAVVYQLWSFWSEIYSESEQKARLTGLGKDVAFLSVALVLTLLYPWMFLLALALAAGAQYLHAYRPWVRSVVPVDIVVYKEPIEKEDLAGKAVRLSHWGVQVKDVLLYNGTVSNPMATSSVLTKKAADINSAEISRNTIDPGTPYERVGTAKKVALLESLSKEDVSAPELLEAALGYLTTPLLQLLHEQMNSQKNWIMLALGLHMEFLLGRAGLGLLTLSLSLYMHLLHAIRLYAPIARPPFVSPFLRR